MNWFCDECKVYREFERVPDKVAEVTGNLMFGEPVDVYECQTCGARQDLFRVMIEAINGGDQEEIKRVTDVVMRKVLTGKA